jgi:hypothetical protein
VGELGEDQLIDSHYRDHMRRWRGYEEISSVWLVLTGMSESDSKLLGNVTIEKLILSIKCKYHF